MATQQELEQFARETGLDVCIGEEYAAEHEGQLPARLGDMCAWANATGRRTSDGVWRCLGTDKGTGQVSASEGSGWLNGVAYVIRHYPLAAVAVAWWIGSRFRRR